MNELLARLPAKARRGSKARCHALTHGSPREVAARLTRLIAPWGQVRPEDRWMPQGFDDLEEAQLHDATRLLPKDLCRKLCSWWLAVQATTPNWDIASTCTIFDREGLLLIEAKAHDEELIKEQIGKRLRAKALEGTIRNHEQIANAIGKANLALDAVVRGWNLSRDSHYQMSNRFAWSWKLTDLGLPVILVYLGFLNADEMTDKGKPFANGEDWESLVKFHSKQVFPSEVWNKKWTLHGQSFIPLIRSTELPL